jgi:hypothetical protein
MPWGYVVHFAYSTAFPESEFVRPNAQELYKPAARNKKGGELSSPPVVNALA